jgi:hypothetical protein
MRAQPRGGNGETGTCRAALSRVKADHAGIARDVRRRPALLAEVLDCLDAREARVKFGAGKVLRLLSEREPDALLPALDRLAGLLDAENSILKWTAIIAIGNLAAADAGKGRRIDGLLEKLLAPIRGPVMITAGNTILAAGKIALARPDLAERIAYAIMGVERGLYETSECWNIAIGHALRALDPLVDGLRRQRRPVLRFAERHLNNPRPATRKKAEKFVRRHAIVD